MPEFPNRPLRRSFVNLSRVARLLILVAPVVAFHSARGDTELADLIERVEPAVVRIDTKTRDGDGVGSGFAVSRDGLIVTNHHVIAGAGSATVTFKDKSTHPVEGTLFLDANRDIAILKIKSGSYATLELASELPRKGETVVAFGAPKGLSFSATDGIISSVREGEELKSYTGKSQGTWIQTSTPISPGNSGGPLVNSDAKVVGANTMMLLNAQNLNFAISAIDISDAVTQSKSGTLIALKEGAAQAKEEVNVTELSEEQRLEVISKLAEFIESTEHGHYFAKRRAMDILLQVNPKSVSDKKLKGKVARSFKQAAFGDKHNNELAVKGMVKWGGRHSIPYLIELLDIETFHGNETLYDVLSRSKDPRAAHAIARRLGNFFDKDRAAAALRRMGSAAEPALIDMVPSSNRNVSLYAIELLGQSGTEECISMLKKASRRGTAEVRDAAKHALSKVRRRNTKKRDSASKGK